MLGRSVKMDTTIVGMFPLSRNTSIEFLFTSWAREIDKKETEMRGIEDEGLQRGAEHAEKLFMMLIAAARHESYKNR